jgi:hypothetical protein
MELEKERKKYGEVGRDTVLYCTVQFKRMDGIGDGKKEVWRGG